MWICQHSARCQILTQPRSVNWAVFRRYPSHSINNLDVQRHNFWTDYALHFHSTKSKTHAAKECITYIFYNIYADYIFFNTPKYCLSVRVYLVVPDVVQV